MYLLNTPTYEGPVGQTYQLKTSHVASEELGGEPLPKAPLVELPKNSLRFVSSGNCRTRH
jgi:hypothetical protein